MMSSRLLVPLIFTIFLKEANEVNPARDHIQLAHYLVKQQLAPALFLWHERHTAVYKKFTDRVRKITHWLYPMHTEKFLHVQSLKSAIG